MSSNLLRLSVIQKICENWSITAVKVKRRFDWPQNLLFFFRVYQCSSACPMKSFLPLFNRGVPNFLFPRVSDLISCQSCLNSFFLNQNPFHIFFYCTFCTNVLYSRFWLFFIFWIKVMLKTHICLWNKFLEADDSGVSKIARTIPESIAPAELKLPLTLLFKNLVVHYFGLPCLPRR